MTGLAVMVVVVVLRSGDCCGSCGGGCGWLSGASSSHSSFSTFWSSSSESGRAGRPSRSKFLTYPVLPPTSWYGQSMQELKMKKRYLEIESNLLHFYKNKVLLKIREKPKVL